MYLRTVFIWCDEKSKFKQKELIELIKKISNAHEKNEWHERA